MYKYEEKNVIDLMAKVVCAYASNNSIAASDLPSLIRCVYGSLTKITAGNAGTLDVEALKPAVPLKKSITSNYIICLEDGKKFKSLKRHLRANFDLSPDQYRERWALPADYPMVAPNYAKSRSILAKQMGLGLVRLRTGRT